MSVRPTLAVFLLLSFLLCALPQSPTPSSTDAPTAAATPEKKSYDEDKAFALALFKQKHYLEALPVFEGLAKRNPNDTTVLIGLGAGMAVHAATLQNPEAAKQERLKGPGNSASCKVSRQQRSFAPKPSRYIGTRWSYAF